ncbi:MAG: cyclic nucleotide-binding domain-containing protein [Chitinivibrionales bacterium]|nr:cyclic nucleotide-binding domain-containing protein [Chitinivibrionales bacterium]
METPSINDAHVRSLLTTVTIFSGISNENLQFIYDHCSLVSKKSGELIVEEGTDATDIYIVLSGAVKIVLNLQEDPLEIIEIGPGNCIGEASVIGIQRHSATAVVSDDCLLLVISRTALLEIYNTNKDVFSLLILNIARELARRLYHSDQVLLCLEKRRQKEAKKQSSTQ